MSEEKTKQAIVRVVSIGKIESALVLVEVSEGMFYSFLRDGGWTYITIGDRLDIDDERSMGLERAFQEFLRLSGNKESQNYIGSGIIKSIQDDGLKLWREWFEFSGDPWITPEDTAFYYCFFCRGDHPNHEPDCAYVKAGTLLSIPLNDGNY